MDTNDRHKKRIGPGEIEIRIRAEQADPGPRAVKGDGIINVDISGDDKTDSTGRKRLVLNKEDLGHVEPAQQRAPANRLNLQSFSDERPVYLQRSPRIQPPMVKEEVEIPRPPQAPHKPDKPGFVEYVFPLGMLVTALVIAGTTDNPSLLYFMAPMSFLALVGLLARNSAQQKKYREKDNARREKYNAALNLVWDRLSLIGEQLQDNLNENNPDLEECRRRVASRDRRLWERRPADGDFLELRLGVGSLPFPVKVKYPRQEVTIEDDPLLDQALKGEERFKNVDKVPITLPLYEAGLAGIIGSRQSVLNTTRALLAQLAVHHSYDEVKIIVVYNGSENSEWNWLRELPHVLDNSRKQLYMAKDREQARELLAHFYEVVKKREQLFAAGGQGQRMLPHLVFVLADRFLAQNERIMRYLLHINRELGISSLFLFDRIENLPADCGCIVDVNGRNGHLTNLLKGMENSAFVPDMMVLSKADRLADKMRPLRLQNLMPSEDLPEQVSLLNLSGVNRVEELDIYNRWNSNLAYSSLSVPLGVKSGGELLSLDIHDKFHGPHGLVAGTTGSGKSELLQSLILSLAVTYHPHDVMFVLIDYKGGGMANVFKNLPHLAGIITNLSGGQTKRALLSVKSELRRRQSIFEEAGVNHIDRYIKLTKQGLTGQAVPHLVIVVDEFAELKSEHPDFMRELVSTARVGRSLGVHLILATQKPAGVVDEQIWSNARFKICLKVQNTEDSQEMLKRADASTITLPGRAYLQVGNNEIYELFQSAYSGTPYHHPLAVEVGGEKITIEPGDLEDSSWSDRQSPIGKQGDDSSSELSALVAHISALSRKRGVERLEGQWLPPLPEKIALEELGSSFNWNGLSWQEKQDRLKAVIGLADNPAAQEQFPLELDLGQGGHLALYGCPGSGKTTFLQTLIASLCLSHSPEELNLYLLDYGGRTLNIFSAMPHVGGILTVEDEEKLKRFMKMTLKELERRKNLFGEKAVGSLQAYREAADEIMPSYVIAIDNYPALFELHPETEDFFVQISREGGGYGMHLVIAAGGVTSIQYKIAANIKQVITLQQSDKSDYSTVVGRTDGLEPEPFSGRGLIKANPPLEFQTALPADGDTESERVARLGKMSALMGENWQGTLARPVPVLPAVLMQEDLYADQGVAGRAKKEPTLVPLGVDLEELEPAYLDLAQSPHFLVTGKIRCGKSAFLISWASAMARHFSPGELELYAVDSYAMGLYGLKDNPCLQSYAGDQAGLMLLFEKLQEKIEVQKEALSRFRSGPAGVGGVSTLQGLPRLALLIDDFNDFMQMASPEMKDFLEKLVARERRIKFHLIVAALLNDIGANWEPLAKTIKDCQSGLLMADALDQQVFSIRVSYAEGGIPLCVGEGYLVDRGQHKKIKAALAASDERSQN